MSDFWYLKDSENSQIKYDNNHRWARGAHWEQSKAHFSSLGQKLNFEIWFFAFFHVIPTPWGPQI